MECADKGYKDTIRLLVTLGQNYLSQLHVLLTSVAINNPDEHADMYLMHSGIPVEGLKEGTGSAAQSDTAVSRKGGSHTF